LIGDTDIIFQRKLDRADEQQSRDERSKEFAVAAVVILPPLAPR
jgi:hypothetical protein